MDDLNTDFIEGCRVNFHFLTEMGFHMAVDIDSDPVYTNVIFQNPTISINIMRDYRESPIEIEIVKNIKGEDRALRLFPVARLLNAKYPCIKAYVGYYVERLAVLASFLRTHCTDLIQTGNSSLIPESEWSSQGYKFLTPEAIDHYRPFWTTEKDKWIIWSDPRSNFPLVVSRRERWIRSIWPPVQEYVVARMREAGVPEVICSSDELNTIAIPN